VARSRRGERSWSSLSPTYRQRLERAGVTRQAWLSGADLRSARGREPSPPPGAAPRDVTERVIAGEGSRGDIERLRDWSQGSEYSSMSPDTAAALSQIPFPVEQWSDVALTPRADGEAWTMTVTPRGNGYPVTVDIPGGGGAETSGAWEILELLADEEIDYDVGDSG
jgi:hypothetical protein